MDILAEIKSNPIHMLINAKNIFNRKVGNHKECTDRQEEGADMLSEGICVVLFKFTKMK